MKQILEYLEKNPGSKARTIVNDLEIDRSEVNSLLYGKLSSRVFQDKKYNWFSAEVKLGNKREGYVNLLIKKEKKYNYKVVKTKTLIVKKKVISSTLIRNLLENGFLEKANKLLSRNWSIVGIVQKGRQIGKKIGFPTCNISIKDYVLAKPGVYAVKVLRKNNSKHIEGIANLGYRPTFKEKKI